MTATERDRAIAARGVTKRFGQPGAQVTALDDVELQVAAGSFVALRGASGSGKTTLLNVLGGLEVPDSGTVTTAGVDLVTAREDARLALRRDRLAFVFQTFGLLPLLSAAENIEVPMRLQGVAPDARRRRVAELLDRVGLAARADHRPHELSGGEQQRIALARAVAPRPAVLLADEPTAQLDEETSAAVLAWLRELVDTDGVTLVAATHDEGLLAGADVVVELRDGRLHGVDRRRRPPEPARVR